MSQFFASGGQSIGASVSALVLPVNIQAPGELTAREEPIKAKHRPSIAKNKGIRYFS